MDILLLTLGFVCIITGLMGSFLPVIPGPSVSWIGLALLYFTNAVPANYWILGIAFLITVIISVLDYVIPAKGTKKIWRKLVRNLGNKHRFSHRDFCSNPFWIPHRTVCWRIDRRTYL